MGVFTISRRASEVKAFCKLVAVFFVYVSLPAKKRFRLALTKMNDISRIKFTTKLLYQMTPVFLKIGLRSLKTSKRVHKNISNFFTGEVSWDPTVGSGATFSIDDPTITHQVKNIQPI